MKLYSVLILLLALVVATNGWPFFGRGFPFGGGDQDDDDNGGFLNNLFSGIGNWGHHFGKSMSKFGKNLSKSLSGLGEDITKGIGKWGEKFGKGMTNFGENLSKSIKKTVKAAEKEGKDFNKLINNPNNKKTVKVTTKIVNGQEIKTKKTKIVDPKGHTIEEIVSVNSQPIQTKPETYPPKTEMPEPTTEQTKPNTAEPEQKIAKWKQEHGHKLKFIPNHA